MRTRAQTRSANGERDLTRERIRASSRGHTWNPDHVVAEHAGGDASASESDEKVDDRDDDPEFIPSSPIHRKRVRKHGSVRQRKRSRAREPSGAQFAIQNIPFGVFSAVGEMADFKTKVAWSTSCHLAREVVFERRGMDSNWVDAFDDYAAETKTWISQGVGAAEFALVPHKMQRECEFDSKKIRGTFKFVNIFRRSDLFRVAMHTHGGMTGFHRAIECRRRRSEGQRRANESKKERGRIHFWCFRIRAQQTLFPLASKQVLKELGQLDDALSSRAVKSLEEANEQSHHVINRAKAVHSAGKLVNLAPQIWMLLDSQHGWGGSDNERFSFRERFEQTRARCIDTERTQDFPDYDETSTLVEEGSKLLVKAQDEAQIVAFQGVSEYLHERAKVEAAWTPDERDRFIQEELAHVNANPSPPSSMLLSLYRRQATSYDLTSEIVVAARLATDIIVASLSPRHLPSRLTGTVLSRLKKELASSVKSLDHVAWRPTRDDLIRRLIQIGREIAREVTASVTETSSDSEQ